MYGALLMARQNVRKLHLINGIVKRQHCAARITEHDVNTLFFQAFENCLRSCDLQRESSFKYKVISFYYIGKYIKLQCVFIGIAGKDEQCDSTCTSCFKYPSASPCRRTGRKNVIDKEDVFPLYTRAARQ